MADILEFPSEKVQMDKLIQDAIQSSAGHNPALAKCFEQVANEVRETLQEVNKREIVFHFTPRNDSIKENIDLLQTSLEEMKKDFGAIISDLINIILKEKLTTCKILHD